MGDGNTATLDGQRNPQSSKKKKKELHPASFPPCVSDSLSTGEPFALVSDPLILDIIRRPTDRLVACRSTGDDARQTSTRRHPPMGGERSAWKPSKRLQPPPPLANSPHSILTTGRFYIRDVTDPLAHTQLVAPLQPFQSLARVTLRHPLSPSPALEDWPSRGGDKNK